MFPKMNQRKIQTCLTIVAGSIAALFLFQNCGPGMQSAVLSSPSSGYSQPPNPPIISDCNLANELPVVTNWSNAANGYQYLASDQVQFNPTSIPSSGFDTSSLYYTYGSAIPNFLPTFDHYVGTNWSTQQILDTQANSFTQNLCQQTGVGIVLLRPDATVANGRLLDRPGYTQVISGIPMFGSMFIVVLPPNWNSNAPAGTYPILADGFYDVNGFYGGDFVGISKFISQSALNGEPGAIGLFWNGGGSSGTHTFGPMARTQFGEIIDYLKNYGGDKDRIVTAGISRGACTALYMASNPAPHDYTVRYVYAAAPMPKLGRLSSLVGTTFPIFYNAADLAFGLENAWMPGWTYPAAAGNQGLTGLGVLGAWLTIETGSSDPADVDQNYALIAPAMIQALKAAGTEVYLALSSNDSYMPHGFNLDYLRTLTQSGIPVQANWYLLGSHGQAWQSSADANITYALAALMNHQQPTVQNGVVSYNKVDRPSHKMVSFAPPGGQTPFSIAAPQVTYTTLPSALYFSGAPGTQYHLQIINRSTNIVTDVQGTIQSTWDDVYSWNPQATGHYDFLSLQIMPPSGGWQSLSLRDTASATADRMYADVISGTPAAQTGASLNANLVANLNPINDFSIDWGITQVSPTVPQGQVDFRMTIEYTDASGISQELVLSNANPSASVQADLSSSSTGFFHVAAEEIGIDHSLPYSLQEIAPNGQSVDVTTWLFTTVSDPNAGLSPGTYTFNFTYNNVNYVRSVVVNP